MVADMLIRIKNAYLAGRKTVEIPYSKFNEETAKILLKEGYLTKVEVKGINKDAKKKAVELKILRMNLKYEGRKPRLEVVKIVSKPSSRVYVKKEKIPLVLGGRGLVILSTPQGLMTGREAKKKGVGGEIICQVW